MRRLLAVMPLLLCLAATAQPRLTAADYATPPRGADGRVDANALAAQLKELGVSTYYFLIAQVHDWEDLQAFLPKAADSGIDVWPYLLPPSESPPHTKSYSEPYKLDYPAWAAALGELSLKYPNLTCWVIDDFYANNDLFTPEYTRAMRDKGRAVNPKLAFFPIMYYNEITPRFVEDYQSAIDGVIVAYPQDRGDIAHARDILDGGHAAMPGQLSFPGGTHSSAGDYAFVWTTVKPEGTGPFSIQFREWDDFPGETSGYHFKQLLIDSDVVWEADVAEGTREWQDVTLDVTPQLKGKKQAELGFRLYDKKGVANFGARWRVSDLKADGLKIAADLDHPEQWATRTQGDFEAGFGDRVRPEPARFHIPFVVMTAAQPIEFKLRHGEPTTPDRIAQWLDMCLTAQHDGLCDAVVLYCLDLKPDSKEFGPMRDVFQRFTPAIP